MIYCITNIIIIYILYASTYQHTYIVEEYILIRSIAIYTVMVIHHRYYYNNYIG